MFIMEIIVIWISVASLGLTLAAPLGPVNVEIIKHALNKTISHKYAWIAAFLTGIGAMSGDFIVATTALAVGGEILTNVFSNPAVKLCLFSVNILILGYLGLSTLLRDNESQLNNSGNSNSLHQNSEMGVSKKFFLKRYFTGLSLVFSSPWTYLWWISAGSIILFSDLGNAPDFYSRIAIVIMFLSGILLWNLFFCTLLSIIGRSPNPTYFKWITKGTAIILLLLIILPAIGAWESLVELLNPI